MTTLCIARHGETDWNTAGILQGWTDVAINDTGRGQARELAKALAHENFVRIYSSPLQRAWETAQIIAAELNLPEPTRVEGIKERHFGIAQGIPKVELAVSNPALLHEIVRRNPASHFDGGETMNGFATRVLDAIMAIAAEMAGGQALVVTHGWVMDVITRHIHHQPTSAVLNVKPKNMECLWLRAGRRSIQPLHHPPGGAGH